MKLTHCAAQIRASVDRVDDSYSFFAFKGNGLEPAGDAAHPIAPESILLSDVALLSMANDPAHGGKISPGNQNEAVVGTMAIHLRVLPKLSREMTGKSEFLDRDTGKTWDVKSPISPPPHQTWVFDPHHHLDNLREDLACDDNVLLDLSRVGRSDRDALLQLLSQDLSSQEKSKVLVFSTVNG